MSAIDLKYLRKRHSDDKKLLGVRVDPAVHARLTALCDKAGVKLQAYLEALILKDLADRDGRGAK